MIARVPRRSSSSGRVVGQELRIDVQLADAARDELGELAAEIEDGHGAGCRRDRADGAIVRRPVGGRGVQRGLEIGLHLGVVGGQDAMARVGRLAVDRLASRLWLVGRPPGRRTRRLVRRLRHPRCTLRSGVAACHQCTGRTDPGPGQGWLRIASAAISR